MQICVRIRHPKVAWFRILVIGLAAMTGCGGTSDTPSLGTVNGTVSFNGAPLAKALVSFSPVDGGRGSTATTDESGAFRLEYTYDLPGAVVGNHLVQIYSTDQPGEGAKDPLLPPKYNVKSELKATVKSGSNVINFPLDSSGTVSMVTP